METIAAMDVEEQPLPTINNVKSFGLKNYIQTNFGGDDYVFQIIPKDDWSAMAVSLSTNAVKLYSPVTGQYYGECKGHTATINQISFSGHSNPNILSSCSSDGTIRAWDTRTFQQVSIINTGPSSKQEDGSSQEVFSFSIGGPGGNLIAAGCESEVLLWDWRNNKQIACLEDSHSEDVTQVQFVPDEQGKLISASVDGLICIFDTTGDINEDNCIESVANVGTSIAKVGFFGENYQKLWCLTNIETLSIWDWKELRNEANFSDARALASKSWNLDNVDYFVDCHYSREAEKLWVSGGTNAGTVGYFPVNYSGMATIGAAEAILEGGHTGIVRSVLPMSITHSGLGSSSSSSSHSSSILGWTGGEDGRLCCWLSDDSPQKNQSWISSALIMKPERTCKRNRHHPY